MDSPKQYQIMYEKMDLEGQVNYKIIVFIDKDNDKETITDVLFSEWNFKNGIKSYDNVKIDKFIEDEFKNLRGKQFPMFASFADKNFGLIVTQIESKYNKHINANLIKSGSQYKYNT